MRFNAQNNNNNFFYYVNNYTYENTTWHIEIPVSYAIMKRAMLRVFVLKYITSDFSYSS